ncbi:MAG TPA: M20 family metallopeptidase [Acidimicrobiales bacterium]|nr:M20 family metallopeptidase [Acidimicrobiales bacterium]
MTTVMTAKENARASVDEARGALVDLSHRIHAKPETCFEEEKGCEWTAAALDDANAGFKIDMGVADLPTAFVATAGTGPLHIGICAEYDALPGVGHACGHNVIAAAAVGAGIALARIADDIGITVSVLGTPAEEGGGGKIFMLERGAFDGIHASMMVHPAPFELDHMPCAAASMLNIAYTGKTAHASAFPELGINAADALTVAQVGIGLLRQHMRSDSRIHGIVTKGGDAPNIVPGDTTGEWIVRAPTLDRLSELEPRVRACFEAGALATGAKLEITEKCPAYSEFADDIDLMALYRRNAIELGRKPLEDASSFPPASTDMANISLAMPAIHPLLGLGSFPAVNHQPEFTAFCATAVADQAAIDGAVGMAWTVIDAAADEALSKRLRAAAPRG